MPNGDPVGTGFQLLSSLLTMLESGDIRVKSDRASNLGEPCPKDCPWRRALKRVYVRTVKVAGLFLERARLELDCAFEYDGCSVNDARIVPGPGSTVGLLSGASFDVVASAGPSRIGGPSGCPECCEASRCVNFDVQILHDAALTVGTGTDHIMLHVCGDGSARRI
jgi:hypothetical protein